MFRVFWSPELGSNMVEAEEEFWCMFNSSASTRGRIAGVTSAGIPSVSLAAAGEAAALVGAGLTRDLWDQPCTVQGHWLGVQRGGHSCDSGKGQDLKGSQRTTRICTPSCDTVETGRSKGSVFPGMAGVLFQWHLEHVQSSVWWWAQWGLNFQACSSPCPAGNLPFP